MTVTKKMDARKRKAEGVQAKLARGERLSKSELFFMLREANIVMATQHQRIQELEREMARLSDTSQLISPPKRNIVMPDGSTRRV